MKKILYLIILAVAAIACTDLDDKIYDRIPAELYPENLKQVSTIMSPVYLPMKSFLDDGGGWWYAQEVSSDEMVVPTRDGDWGDGNKWVELHTHTWNNFNGDLNNMWFRFYEGVAEANRLIEVANTWEDNKETSTFKAKLKIMRGYYYYLIIDNYGDAPYVTSYSNAPEYPTKISRSSLFDSVVTDIESSIPLLSEDITKTGVSKGMAYSLLAKLYLNAETYTGRTDLWDEAEAACDSVIALGLYRLEITVTGAFVTENQNSPENIWEIPYDEDSYSGFLLHLRTLHYEQQYQFDMTAGTWNGFCAVEDHFKTFTTDDKRKEAYFLVGPQYSSTGEPLYDNIAKANLVLDPFIPMLVMVKAQTFWLSYKAIRMSGARVQKFEIKMGAKFDLSNDFPIFRYADILLMKGEAMIRQGENGDEYINMIRSRAGLDPWANVTLDQILEERGREMFWEAHRRQDLIRFGKFGDAWWEKDASGPERTVFPIPQAAIDANPNLAD